MTFCVIDKLVIGRHTDTVTLSEECPLSCSTFFLFERVDAHGILNLNAHWCHHDRFEFCLTSPESLMLLSSVASVFSSLVFIFFGAMLHMSWKSSELQPRNHVPRSSSCGNQWKLSQFRLSTLLDSFLGHRVW